MAPLKSLIILAAIGVIATPAAAAQSPGEPATGRVATPFAQKVFCLRNPEECRVRSPGKDVAVVAGRVVLSSQRMAELRRVNDAVNAQIAPRPEKAGLDTWQIGGSSGDCEDYVLTKRKMLNELGWPSSSTLIANVRTGRDELHAVLVVRTDGGNFVLDNLASAVSRASDLSYAWISVQSPSDPMKWQKASAE